MNSKQNIINNKLLDNYDKKTSGNMKKIMRYQDNSGFAIWDTNDSNNINTGNDNNFIEALRGDDKINSGTGNDTFRHYGIDDGHDTIRDDGGNSDRLQFMKINPKDLWLQRVNNDLVFSICAKGKLYELVTVNGHFNTTGEHKIEFLLLGWNEEYSIDELVKNMVQGKPNSMQCLLPLKNYEKNSHVNQNNSPKDDIEKNSLVASGNFREIHGGNNFSRPSIFGTEFSDNINTGNDNNFIEALRGDDKINSGTGNDTFRHYGIDDGHDTIRDAGGNNDRLQFMKINPKDLWLQRVNDDLVFSTCEKGKLHELVTVNGHFNTTGEHKIEFLLLGWNDKLGWSEEYSIDELVKNMVQGKPNSVQCLLPLKNLATEKIEQLFSAMASFPQLDVEAQSVYSIIPAAQQSSVTLSQNLRPNSFGGV